MSEQLVGAKFVRDSVAFFRSQRRGQARIIDLSVGQVRIRIHVSSEALWDVVFPALAWNDSHSVRPPDVEIFAFEGRGDIVSPWGLDQFRDGGRIQGLESGNVLASFDVEHSMLSIFDRSINTGVFWVGSAEGIPEWEFGAPLRSLLTWALLDKGIHVVHSAGVAIAGTGVLLVGPGGSGKSTTTAICTQNGFQTTGDDYCAVSFGMPAQIFGLYGLLKLVPGAMGTELLGDAQALVERSDGKVHFDLGTSLTGSVTLGSLVFTRVGSAPTPLVPLSPQQAFLRLIPSTLNQSSLPQPELFRALSAVCQAVPAFELEVGTDTRKTLEILGSLCGL